MVLKYHHEVDTKSATTTDPVVQIRVALTSNVHRRSAPTSEHPQLTVTATLVTPSVLTIETRGETDSGTILEDGFRAQHFSFYDTTTSKPVVHKLFPGTCDARCELETYNVVEMRSSQPIATRTLLDDISPLSDPVNILEIGHEYRLTLKPQRVRCWNQSVADIFGDKEWLSEADVPEAMKVLLACEDELLLKVEA